MSTRLIMNTGNSIPTLGFGTWGLDKGRETASIETALRAGYEHVDTAKIYGSETNVKEAIANLGIPREKLFITTKLWNADQGYETALKAIDESLDKLGMAYVDLYLIHWPYTHQMSGDNKREETWKAMEDIYLSGKARAIGVSNYVVEHLEEMVSKGGYATIPPAVNQIECHPLWSRGDVVDYCHRHGIVVTQYSPLTRKEALNHPVIEKVAQKHGKTGAQVLLRWGLQRNNVVIPKSSNDQHIRENADVFDFFLTDEDMEALNSLDENRSVL
jgi:diketogulonate reductase-like aldo/keto reductase